MNRLRKFFESIVYAGMTPGGAAPSDPFYLTNRSMGQRIRLAAVIAVPCLLVATAIGLAALGYFDDSTPKAPPAPTLTPEQVATKMLPNLDRDLKIDTNKEIEVPDVHVEKGAVTKLAGTIRNNTDRVMENVEVVFDLTDASGSRLGAVSAKVAKVPPKGTADFLFPVEQHEAAFALVREIR